MKRILTLAMIALFGIYTLNSQSLQFSQVKLITDSEETVPPGKIWKIESVMDGAARKAFSPYFIKVNGNNIYFSDYSYGGKGWMDVSQIKIYYKQNQTCANTPTLYFKYHGFEGNTPFWGRTSSGTVQNNSSWHLVLTISPQTPTKPLSITHAMLYIAYWESSDVRLDITYTDGSTDSMTIPGYQSSVCQSNSYYFIGSNPGSSSSSTYAEVPESEIFKSNTKLPIWLPANTLLKAGDNVKYISVMEFDVIP